ncbi:hypothetical protein JD844_001761 [Phrynosoma platyrhinos]|uniref:UBC core domain-containing protein n=1 Tax=Phrynosoma platyrhinos TaxID=52577 RepID=A0ABQ7TAF2_PHRPL|nr:hypothetical protein JD844_001761 [Phrynosoma platyrhinos]
MIKLFSLKQQKKEEESAGGTKGSSKKASAAQLRIQKDINELNLPKTCEIDFSDQDDLLNFKLVICPDEGFYKGGKFVFSFKLYLVFQLQVGQGYPHDPPKVKCETMVYHPNIDLEGNVCLNILREDWKPVLTINSIIYGLQYLFLAFALFTMFTLDKLEMLPPEHREAEAGLVIRLQLLLVKEEEEDRSVRREEVRLEEEEEEDDNDRGVRREEARQGEEEDRGTRLSKTENGSAEDKNKGKEPNPEDPLNKEAAEVLQNNRRLFEQNVQRSMRGGYIGSTYFERCLK